MPSPPGLKVGLVTILVVLTAVVVAMTVAPSNANAATVRAGAHFGQIDVLLNGVETQRAATSYWGAQTVCWGVTGGAWALGGIAGAVLGNLGCTAMVATCAAQAYYAHRWAGMTFYPFSYFCWKY